MKNFLLDKHFVVKWTFFIVTLNSRWGLIFPKPSFYWQKWKLKKMKAQPALLFSNSSGYRQGYEFSLKGFPEVPILSKSWWRSSMLLLKASNNSIFKSYEQKWYIFESSLSPSIFFERNCYVEYNEYLSRAAVRFDTNNIPDTVAQVSISWARI